MTLVCKTNKKNYGKKFFEVKSHDISTVRQPKRALNLFDDESSYIIKDDSVPLGYSAYECEEEFPPIKKGNLIEWRIIKPNRFFIINYMPMLLKRTMLQTKMMCFLKITFGVWIY